MELARRLGVTHQAVTSLKRDGKVVMRGKKVLFSATMDRLEQSLHPGYSRKALKVAQSRGKADESGEDLADDGESHISLSEAQRRKAIAAAALAELDLAERSAALIDKAGAEKHIFEFVRGLRDAIENFPVRYAAQIGAELGVPAAKVNAALSKRLKDYLGELADRQLRL
jgi:hypothetical protein